VTLVPEHRRAEVVQPGAEPGVVVGLGVQVPPVAVGVGAVNEPALPQVLAVVNAVQVPSDAGVTVRQAATAWHALWLMKVPVVEHVCPDAVHMQLHKAALPVGPAYASRTVGYCGGQFGGGAAPDGPVQSKAGPSHVVGTDGAHAYAAQAGSAQSVRPLQSASIPFVQFSVPR
jgi:hypothetical protein